MYTLPGLHPVEAGAETFFSCSHIPDMLTLRAWPSGRSAVLGVHVYRTQDTSIGRLDERC